MSATTAIKFESLETVKQISNREQSSLSEAAKKYAEKRQKNNNSSENQLSR